VSVGEARGYSLASFQEASYQEASYQEASYQDSGVRTAVRARALVLPFPPARPTSSPSGGEACNSAARNSAARGRVARGMAARGRATRGRAARGRAEDSVGASPDAHRRS